MFLVISTLIADFPICLGSSEDKIIAAGEGKTEVAPVAEKTTAQSILPEKKYNELATFENFDKVVNRTFLVEPLRQISDNSWLIMADFIKLLKSIDWKGKQNLDAVIIQDAVAALILNPGQTLVASIFVEFLQKEFSKANENMLQVWDSIIKLESTLGTNNFSSVFSWLPIVFNGERFEIRFDVFSRNALNELKRLSDKFNTFLNNLKGKNAKEKISSLNELKKMFPGDRAKKIPDLHNNRNSTAQTKCVSIIAILNNLIKVMANQ
jgi:hypothetical protein